MGLNICKYFNKKSSIKASEILYKILGKLNDYNIYHFYKEHVSIYVDSIKYTSIMLSNSK